MNRGLADGAVSGQPRKRQENANEDLSIYRLTIEVKIDEEALAAHDGRKIPPPNAVEDWNSADRWPGQRPNQFTDSSRVQY